MEPVNYELGNVFKVAMAPAFYIPDTYFIFRSTREQIVIIITGNSFVSTSFLDSEELEHIEKYYPFLDTINYKVKPK
jgi:hypothetical protein